ncbi:glycosyltransferase family 39 protein [Patescibacteria group bacterium]|nr:glycosyltransferase family 39 protein [Patescibacteria group bacterium]
MNIISNFFKKILSEKYNLYLTLLIIFHILFFSIFHILNKNYQTWDSAGHIGLSYRMAREIQRYSSGVEGASLKTILKISNYYPPFVQLIGSFISLSFDFKSVFLLIETLIFFILSIIFTYKLVFLLTRNNRISFITVAIYSLFPQIIDQSHYFHLDIPLTALLLMSIYFLLTSDSFKKILPTILFFIFFSFIQLTKWTGFVFLIVPVLITLYKSFISRTGGVDKRNFQIIIRNLLIGSAIFLILVVPWYRVNWTELLDQIRVFSKGESDDPQSLWESLFYYPANAISHQIMFLPFVLAVISIIYHLKNNWKKGLTVLASILIPWILFVFISNKNLRYTLPLTPLIAYLIAAFLESISSSMKIKLKGLTAFTISYLLLASVFLSFFRLEKETPILRPISMFFTGPRYNSWYYYGTSFYAYKPYKYPVDEVLDYIYRDAQETERALGVSVLIDTEEMSAATFELVRLEKGYRNMYMPVPYFQFQAFKSDDEVKAFFTETRSKYVISSTHIGPEGLRNYQALKQCSLYLESKNNDLFDRVKTINLPDGQKLFVYKIKDSIVSVEAMDGCKIGAGVDDGVETFKLTPNHTYTMFTGHFAIQDKIKVDYEPGVIYLVQVENTIHESMLDIYNLPKSGSSFCSIEGTEIDFSKEIKNALTEENQCGAGIKCKKVIHVKWNVGDSDVEIIEHTVDSVI